MTRLFNGFYISEFCCKSRMSKPSVFRILTLKTSQDKEEVRDPLIKKERKTRGPTGDVKEKSTGVGGISVGRYIIED